MDGRVHTYEIKRELGRGAHGVVYLAYDTHLLRPVVLKTLKRTGGTAPTAQQRERMLREARLASAIDHPNICAVYDVHDDDEQTYIVMQYVPGRPLSMLLEERLSFSFALSIATQITEGLCAAHDLDVVHGDLKPANVMVTEGGLVKLLDFGLARRQGPETHPSEPQADRKGAASSTPWGTVGYMAPERFVGRPPSSTTDTFAVGVLLYEMFAGVHPFWRPPADRATFERNIQFGRYRPLVERENSRVPAALSAIVDGALSRNPGQRFKTAAELRDALLTFRETEGLDGASITGRMIAPPPRKPRRARLWGALSTLVGGEAPRPRDATVAVLPFEDADTPNKASALGFALANAVTTRLARTPGISVRASRSLLGVDSLPTDPAEAGRALSVTQVVSGSLARDAGVWLLNWQLVDVATDTAVIGDSLAASEAEEGGAVGVPLALQRALSNSVAGALQTAAGAAPSSPQATEAISPALQEAYFAARATLASFVLRSRQRKDLRLARERLRAVAAEAPDYAPVHAAIGITHLQDVENGFGGIKCLRQAADAFERALALDPGLLEARIFRVRTLLALGEKEAARHAVHHLLGTAPGDFDVRMLAATLLRLDGLYDEALAQLAVALTLSPGDAHRVYSQRTRIYGYRDEIGRARTEADKALELTPHHPQVRVTHGYLKMREGEPDEAVDILEAVVADDPALQMAYPTLALARLRTGDEEGARALIDEHTSAAADCDAEIAYRLATFYAAAGDKDAALRWLLRSIYLGNENYPWMERNPSWAALRDDEDFASTLASLKDHHARHRSLWPRLLG